MSSGKDFADREGRTRGTDFTDGAKVLVQVIGSDGVGETRDVQVHARVLSFIAAPVVPVKGDVQKRRF